MNTTTSSLPRTFDLGNHHAEALTTTPEEPIDALATKVFFYTIAYVVLFVTVGVLLVA